MLISNNISSIKCYFILIKSLQNGKIVVDASENALYVFEELPLHIELYMLIMKCTICNEDGIADIKLLFANIKTDCADFNIMGLHQLVLLIFAFNYASVMIYCVPIK